MRAAAAELDQERVARATAKAAKVAAETVGEQERVIADARVQATDARAAALVQELESLKQAMESQSE